jgi:dTMP kinase
MLGKFITFEGGEGTGKSTQIRLLSQALHRQDIPHIVTREPGGSVGAELIRTLLLTGSTDKWTPVSEALLMYASRAEHWTHTIAPALTTGLWVICDRFADSSLAYQGFGHGISQDFLDDLYRQTVGTQQPHRTYILDLPPAIGLQRSRERLGKELGNSAEGRFETYDLDFHERVHRGFLDIAHKNPNRCLVMNANQETSVIHENIMKDLFAQFICRL